MPPRTERTEIPDELEPLAQEARKYKTAEEFVKAFILEIKHGEYWHVTDNPNFTIIPELGPRDMSSLASGRMDIGRLMITSDLEYWAAEYEGSRKYAAKIDMSEVDPKYYYQVRRGFGNEFFVVDPSKAKVIKVIPIKQALKESKHFQEVLENSIGNKQQLIDFYHLAMAGVEVGAVQNPRIEPKETKMQNQDLESIQVYSLDTKPSKQLAGRSGQRQTYSNPKIRIPKVQPELGQGTQEFTVGKVVDVPTDMPDKFVFPTESATGDIAFVFRFLGDDIHYDYPELDLRISIAVSKTSFGNLGGFFLQLDDGQENVYREQIILADQLLMAHLMDVFAQSSHVNLVFIRDTEVVSIKYLKRPGKKVIRAARQAAKLIREHPAPIDLVDQLAGRAGTSRKNPEWHYHYEETGWRYTYHLPKGKWSDFLDALKDPLLMPVSGRLSDKEIWATTVVPVSGFEKYLKLKKEERINPSLRIVFDLDETLGHYTEREDGTYEFKVRPGATQLLQGLKTLGHTLILWSTGEDAYVKEVVEKAGWASLFSEVYGKSMPAPTHKDIRKIEGDVLVENEKSEMRFGDKHGYDVIVVNSFYEATGDSHKDLKWVDEIKDAINHIESLSESPVKNPDKKAAAKTIYDSIPCVSCGKEAKSFRFRDDTSRKRYRISGLCQECQDKIEEYYEQPGKRIATVLDEVSDECGEEDLGSGYLLKYKGWGSICMAEVTQDEEAHEACCEYAAEQTPRIIDKWKLELVKRGYGFVDGGYYKGGLYGRTWALFKAISNIAKSTCQRR